MGAMLFGAKHAALAVLVGAGIYLAISLIGFGSYPTNLVSFGLSACITSTIINRYEKRLIHAKDLAILFLFFIIFVIILDYLAYLRSGDTMTQDEFRWVMLTVVTNQSLAFIGVLFLICRPRGREASSN
jgi:hypothetical protein